ncbi:hypothetical protein T439DRAFT_332163 [Meredithblackwellia eburnea MCA 4105]
MRFSSSMKIFGSTSSTSSDNAKGQLSPAVSLSNGPLEASLFLNKPLPQLPILNDVSNAITARTATKSKDKSQSRSFQRGTLKKRMSRATTLPGALDIDFIEDENQIHSSSPNEKGSQSKTKGKNSTSNLRTMASLLSLSSFLNSSSAPVLSPTSSDASVESDLVLTPTMNSGFELQHTSSQTSIENRAHPFMKHSNYSEVFFSPRIEAPEWGAQQETA